MLAAASHSGCASETEDIHLLPNLVDAALASDTKPSYEQKHFAVRQEANQWHRLVGSEERAERNELPLSIDQDMYLDATMLHAGENLDVTPKENHSVYLQVATGNVTVDGEELSAGDAWVSDAAFAISADSDSEMLAFHLAE